MPRMKATSRPKAPAPLGAAGDRPPETIDEFRLALALRIERALAEGAGCWRTCREAACRRARACRASQSGCSALPPAPPVTAEEEAQCLADLRRELDEIRARRQRAEGDGIDQQS